MARRTPLRVLLALVFLAAASLAAGASTDEDKAAAELTRRVDAVVAELGRLPETREALEPWRKKIDGAIAELELPEPLAADVKAPLAAFDAAAQDPKAKPDAVKRAAGELARPLRELIASLSPDGGRTAPPGALSGAPATAGGPSSSAGPGGLASESGQRAFYDGAADARSLAAAPPQPAALATPVALPAQAPSALKTAPRPDAPQPQPRPRPAASAYDLTRRAEKASELAARAPRLLDELAAGKPADPELADLRSRLKSVSPAEADAFSARLYSYLGKQEFTTLAKSSDRSLALSEAALENELSDPKNAKARVALADFEKDWNRFLEQAAARVAAACRGEKGPDAPRELFARLSGRPWPEELDEALEAAANSCAKAEAASRSVQSRLAAALAGAPGSEALEAALARGGLSPEQTLALLDQAASSLGPQAPGAPALKQARERLAAAVAERAARGRILDAMLASGRRLLTQKLLEAGASPQAVALAGTAEVSKLALLQIRRDHPEYLRFEAWRAAFGAEQLETAPVDASIPVEDLGLEDAAAALGMGPGATTRRATLEESAVGRYVDGDKRAAGAQFISADGERSAFLSADQTRRVLVGDGVVVDTRLETLGDGRARFRTRQSRVADRNEPDVAAEQFGFMEPDGSAVVYKTVEPRERLGGPWRDTKTGRLKMQTILNPDFDYSSLDPSELDGVDPRGLDQALRLHFVKAALGHRDAKGRRLATIVVRDGAAYVDTPETYYKITTEPRDAGAALTVVSYPQVAEKQKEREGHLPTFVLRLAPAAGGGLTGTESDVAADVNGRPYYVSGKAAAESKDGVLRVSMWDKTEPKDIDKEIGAWRAFTEGLESDHWYNKPYHAMEWVGGKVGYVGEVAVHGSAGLISKGFGAVAQFTPSESAAYGAAWLLVQGQIEEAKAVHGVAGPDDDPKPDDFKKTPADIVRTALAMIRDPKLAEAIRQDLMAKAYDDMYRVVGRGVDRGVFDAAFRKSHPSDEARFEALSEYMVSEGGSKAGLDDMSNRGALGRVAAGSISFADQVGQMAACSMALEGPGGMAGVAGEWLSGGQKVSRFVSGYRALDTLVRESKVARAVDGLKAAVARTPVGKILGVAAPNEAAEALPADPIGRARSLASKTAQELFHAPMTISMDGTYRVQQAGQIYALVADRDLKQAAELLKNAAANRVVAFASEKDREQAEARAPETEVRPAPKSRVLEISRARELGWRVGEALQGAKQTLGLGGEPARSAREAASEPAAEPKPAEAAPRPAARLPSEQPQTKVQIVPGRFVEGESSGSVTQRVEAMRGLIEDYLRDRLLKDDPATLQAALDRLRKIEWKIDGARPAYKGDRLAPADAAGATMNFSGEAWKRVNITELAGVALHEFTHTTRNDELASHIVQADFNTYMNERLARDGLDRDLKPQKRFLGRMKDGLMRDSLDRKLQDSADLIEEHLDGGTLEKYIDELYGRGGKRPSLEGIRALADKYRSEGNIAGALGSSLLARALEVYQERSGPSPKPAARAADAPVAAAATAVDAARAALLGPLKDGVGLGEKLGEGRFGEVFGLKDRPELVAKIKKPGAGTEATAWAANEVGPLKELARTDIPHAELVAAEADGSVIVKRKITLPDGSPAPGLADLVEKGPLTPAQKANFVELTAKLLKYGRTADLPGNNLLWNGSEFVLVDAGGFVAAHPADTVSMALKALEPAQSSFGRNEFLSLLKKRLGGDSALWKEIGQTPGRLAPSESASVMKTSRLLADGPIIPEPLSEPAASLGVDSLSGSPTGSPSSLPTGALSKRTRAEAPERWTPPAERTALADDVRRARQSGGAAPDFAKTADAVQAELKAATLASIDRQIAALDEGRETAVNDAGLRALNRARRRQLAALGERLRANDFTLRFEKSIGEVEAGSLAHQDGREFVFNLDYLDRDPRVLAAIAIHEGIHGMHFEGGAGAAPTIADKAVRVVDGRRVLTSNLISEYLAHEIQPAAVEAIVPAFDPGWSVEAQLAAAGVDPHSLAVARGVHDVGAFDKGAQTLWDYLIEHNEWYQQNFGGVPKDAPAERLALARAQALVEVRATLERMLAEQQLDAVHRAYDAAEAALAASPLAPEAVREARARQDALMDNFLQRPRLEKALADLDRTLAARRQAALDRAAAEIGGAPGEPEAAVRARLEAKRVEAAKEYDAAFQGEDEARIASAQAEKMKLSYLSKQLDALESAGAAAAPSGAPAPASRIGDALRGWFGRPASGDGGPVPRDVKRLVIGSGRGKGFGQTPPGPSDVTIDVRLWHTMDIPEALLNTPFPDDLTNGRPLPDSREYVKRGGEYREVWLLPGSQGAPARAVPRDTPGAIKLVQQKVAPDVGADLNRLPMASGSFEEVLFENIPFDAFTGRNNGGIKECARVLKPGGKMIIQTGSFAPADEIRQAVRDAGLSILSDDRSNAVRIVAVKPMTLPAPGGGKPLEIHGGGEDR